MKISIKRAQSQAGLSFAERQRVGELCSGMREKFRPKVKTNKLLLLLALLMTAATGAWADGGVDGTIVWSVGNETSATVSASIKDAISSTSVTTGSGLTVATATYFDTEMVKYTPATANAGHVIGVMIEYRIEAVNGYKFNPTGVNYAAVQVGSDQQSYSWSYTIDGVESTITDVSKSVLLRNNGSNSGTAQLMHSESITANGCSVFTLRFYISNCGNTKNICIGNITISGTVSDAAPAAPKHLIAATSGEETLTMKQALPYETTVIDAITAISGSAPATATISVTGVTSSNPDVVSVGTLDGWNTPVTVKADGNAAVTLSLSFQGSPVSKIVNMSVVPPLYVALADGTQDADKWTAATDGTTFGALPIGGLKGDGTETVTLKYSGRLKVKNIKATSDAGAAAGKVVDLSTLKESDLTNGEYIVADGMTITGTLDGATQPYKITIPDGATVTLDGATINGANSESYKWAGINCAGKATIVLKGTNSVKGFYDEYPGINVPEGKTLTIQGSTGSLNASSNGAAAGIGGGYEIACGNIEIHGGVITATDGTAAAGIGGGYRASCGTITISGGEVTAIGGNYAAGIGSGFEGSCEGGITIANTVTKVTATKGENCNNSIGPGYNGSCGTVTIGGTSYGNSGVTTSPFTYGPSNN